MGRQAPFVEGREYTVLEECMLYSHFEEPINVFSSRPLLLLLSLNAGVSEAVDVEKTCLSTCVVWFAAAGATLS